MWLPYLAAFKCSLVSQWVEQCIVVTERNRIVNIGALLTQIWECRSETWRRNDSHCFRLDCSALAIIIIVIIIIIIILIILEIHPLDKFTSFHKFNFNGCDDELLKQLQTINLVQEGQQLCKFQLCPGALVVNDAKTFKQGSNSKESSNRVIGKRQKAVSPPPRWHPPPPPSPPSSPPVYMNYLSSSNCRYISTMEWINALQCYSCVAKGSRQMF